MPTESGPCEQPDPKPEPKNLSPSQIREIAECLLQQDAQQGQRIYQLEQRVRELESVRDTDFKRELARRLRLDANPNGECLAEGGQEDPTYRLRRLLRT